MEKIYKYIESKSKNKDDLRERAGIFAGITGIFLNLFLACLKFIIGTVSNSIAIMADATNNLFDMISSIVTILGFKMANKEADEEHPYGHGRVEYIASAIIALMVILVGIQFLYFSFQRIVGKSQVKFDLTSLILLVVSIFIKGFLAWLNRYLGRKIDSQILLGVSLDAIGDVFTTIIVIMPILLSRFTSLQIDGYIGILLAILIVKSGLELFVSSANPLIGERADEEIVKIVEEEIRKYRCISNIHELVYENRGGGHSLVVVSVEMPARFSLSQCHLIIDRIERKVEEEHNIHLIIHPEPKGHLNEEEEELLKNVKTILASYQEVLGVYDFKIIEGSKQVLIDIELSDKLEESYNEKKEEISKLLEGIGDYDWNVRFFIKTI